MAGPKLLNLPAEVRLVLEVMPCQALRRSYDFTPEPHPCAYFAEWGRYHSYDYPASGAPETPGIVQPVVYAGKTSLVPEALSGCRKAPLMAVGINPNLPGYWSRTHNALNPLFDDFLQYAHYFRYRSVAKLQMPRTEYESLLHGRDDSPREPEPLLARGTPIEAEPAALTMYTAYQSLLDALAQRQGWAGHKLALGEDLSYGNMVACPSAKWVVRPDPRNPEMPVMGAERTRGIVRECFHERRYFLRQLFQSLPVALLVFSETTAREFITAMQGRFVKGAPQPGEDGDALAEREIRLGYGVSAEGQALTARVIFVPHASANPGAFEAFKARAVDMLSEEVAAGRLAFDAVTGHLARPRGACRFCTNDLYRIGPCDYEAELKPLAPQAKAAAELLAAEPAPAGAEGPIARENAEQARLLTEFLAHPARAAAAAPEAELAAAVDEPTSPPLVVRGRIVTMNAQRDVVADGKLYLKQGAIVALRPAGDPAPEGFSGATVFDTAGVVYPGLLDLHNHLAYNVAKLWRVPKVFHDRGRWQGDTSYRENVKLPLNALGNDPDTVKAIVRYVEVKALLGGCTSVQGMRSQVAGVKLFSGAVRNFEGTDDPRLPDASSWVLDLKAGQPDEVARFRGKLEEAALLYHLAEGTLDSTRQRFVDLRERDLLRPALVGIHALALEAGDFAALEEHGCKVVWSPFSNQLLYGETLDPAHLQGLVFALGCDWSPSGSKNPLEELKVAWLTQQAKQAGLKLEDLCAALTSNAARAVGWDGALGSLEPGKYADLAVLGAKRDDAYENLLHATERDVRLVVIAGQPRYGDASLMALFAPSQGRREPLTVGGASKELYLRHPHDALAGLTFAAARATLEHAVAHLHEIQAKVAAAASAAAFSAAGDEEPFRLLLDNDEPEDEAELLASAAVLPESIPLDPPTVIDDPDHFARLESIAHLPAHLRALRGFYQ